MNASASRNADALDVVAIQSRIASGATPVYAVEQLNLARSQSLEPPLCGRFDFTGGCQRFAMDLARVEAQTMRLSALEFRAIPDGLPVGALGYLARADGGTSSRWGGASRATSLASVCAAERLKAATRL